MYNHLISLCEIVWNVAKKVSMIYIFPFLRGKGAQSQMETSFLFWDIELFTNICGSFREYVHAFIT